MSDDHVNNSKFPYGKLPHFYRQRGSLSACAGKRGNSVYERCVKGIIPLHGGFSGGTDSALGVGMVTYGDRSRKLRLYIRGLSDNLNLRNKLTARDTAERREAF